MKLLVLITITAIILWLFCRILPDDIQEEEKQNSYKNDESK